MNQPTEYFITDVGWQYPIGLSLERAVEVLTLTADEICPLPVNVPAVLGTIGWRGQLVWTIALEEWLCLSTADLSGYAVAGQINTLLPALVLQEINLGRTLSCVVRKLYGIESVRTQDLDPLPDTVPDAVRRHLRGKVPHSDLLILDDRQLFNPQAWLTPTPYLLTPNSYAI